MNPDDKVNANTTKKERWAAFFYDNLVSLFAESADVSVVPASMWSLEGGEEEASMVPEVCVLFGHPKGTRPSYQRWKEGGFRIAVTFDIWTSSTDAWETMEKRDLYVERGVEEHYVYDPEANHFRASVRTPCGEGLRAQRFRGSFTSSRLGIRFDITGPELRVFFPNGQPFLPFATAPVPLTAEARAEAAEKRLARMAELSRKARKGLTSPEELTELKRLEGPEW
jgi:hypothetical protein